MLVVSERDYIVLLLAAGLLCELLVSWLAVGLLIGVIKAGLISRFGYYSNKHRLGTATIALVTTVLVPALTLVIEGDVQDVYRTSQAAGSGGIKYVHSSEVEALNPWPPEDTTSTVMSAFDQCRRSHVSQSGKGRYDFRVVELDNAGSRIGCRTKGLTTLWFVDVRWHCHPECEDIDQLQRLSVSRDDVNGKMREVCEIYRTGLKPDVMDGVSSRTLGTGLFRAAKMESEVRSSLGRLGVRLDSVVAINSSGVEELSHCTFSRVVGGDEEDDPTRRAVAYVVNDVGGKSGLTSWTQASGHFWITAQAGSQEGGRHSDSLEPSFEKLQGLEGYRGAGLVASIDQALWFPNNISLLRNVGDMVTNQVMAGERLSGYRTPPPGLLERREFIDMSRVSRRKGVRLGRFFLAILGCLSTVAALTSALTCLASGCHGKGGSAALTLREVGLSLGVTDLRSVVGSDNCVGIDQSWKWGVGWVRAGKDGILTKHYGLVENEDPDVRFEDCLASCQSLRDWWAGRGGTALISTCRYRRATSCASARSGERPGRYQHREGADRNLRQMLRVPTVP